LDLGLENDLTFKRIVRLLQNLCSNPSYVLRYISGSLLNPSSYIAFNRQISKHGFSNRKKMAADKRYPWFSYAAIDFLETFLTKKMTVFEWGSGNSTLFFAQRCASVCSVESHSEWLKFLKEEIDYNKISNVEIRMCPIASSNTKDFEQSSYLNNIGDDLYDVIIVDGYDPEPFTWRPLCFYRAQRNIKPGGLIVVDDSWRYEQIRSANSAKSFLTFESVGPGRLGVTTTDIYFY
jgi:Methyltransferase domain